MTNENDVTDDRWLVECLRPGCGHQFGTNLPLPSCSKCGQKYGTDYKWIRRLEYDAKQRKWV